jgi:hypothetical protein
LAAEERQYVTANQKKAIRYYTLWDVDLNAWEDAEEVDHTREEAIHMLEIETANVWVECDNAEVEVWPMEIHARQLQFILDRVHVWANDLLGGELSHDQLDRFHRWLVTRLLEQFRRYLFVAELPTELAHDNMYAVAEHAVRAAEMYVTMPNSCPPLD